MRHYDSQTVYLVEIAGKASTLGDRMSGGLVFDDAATDPARTRERMELWRRMAAAGDPERFARRLDWDGLSEDDAERLVGTWRFGNAPLPGWTETLASVLERYTGRRRNDTPSEAPFEEFLAPFVEEAWSRLERGTTGISLLTENAAGQLRERLLRKMVLGAAPVLLGELSIRKAMGESPLDAMFRKATGRQTRTHFDAMMEHLWGAGLLDFFLEYAVMTRFLCQLIDQWVGMMEEYLARLEADYDDIAVIFGLSGRPKVKELHAELSDPHDGGRCVILAVFEDDSAIIYKPRGSAQWEAWDGLLSWMNARDIPLPFFRIKYLRKSPHLWQEFVPARPCPTRVGVQNYYRRMGHLMAVLHVLRGTDIHNENVIAHGEHPVLVDIEMLLQGRHRYRQTALVLKAIHDRVCETFCGSVIATGLLPFWIDSDRGEEYDVSGAGGVDPFRHIAVFRNAGTDDMTMEFERIPEWELNAVRLDGKVIGLTEGRDDLLAGLDEMLRWLIARKGEWTGHDGPLEPLLEQPVRFLLRDTGSYIEARRMAMEPGCLRDGIDFSLRLESMAARWTVEERGGDIWPLYREELASVERLDIPLFTVMPCSQTVTGRDGTELPMFEVSGQERARALLESMHEREAAFQVEMAGKAITSHADMLAVDENLRERPPLRTDSTVDDDAFARDAITRAERIAADILHKRLCIDGASWWIEPSYDGSMRRMKLGIMGLSLYHGTPGVSLFIAAYEKATGDSTYRHLVYEIMDVARPYLKNGTSARSLARELGIGGIIGTGGLVYALARCGDMLGDPALVDEAETLASMIDGELVVRDRKLDIIGGSAGAICALLALHRTRPGSAALAAARLCGEHLLAMRGPWRNERSVWIDCQYGVPISGFSHGAAGISFALWRLYDATGDERFAEAARQGVAFEDGLLELSVKNWHKSPDEALNRKWGYWSTWCHGSPGIGLGRLGMLEMGEDAGRDAMLALDVLTTMPEHDCDHLCCGNLGRLELLLAAGKKLGRKDYVTAALSGAAQILSEREGIDFRFNPHLPPGPISPALFVGTAGIGYELLRLAHPDKLPSILLLD